MLKTNQLIGFGSGTRGHDFIRYVNSLYTSSTNTPSWNGFSAGLGWADRKLVAVITGYCNNTADSTFGKSITIGGVSGSTEAFYTVTGGGQTWYTAFSIASVPTGSSINVSGSFTSFAGTFSDWWCSLYTVDNISSTLQGEDGNTSGGSINFSTSGAELVFLAEIGAISTFTGGNGPVTNINENFHGHGYDISTPFSTTETYDTDNGHTTLYGASFNTL